MQKVGPREKSSTKNNQPNAIKDMVGQERTYLNRDWYNYTVASRMCESSLTVAPGPTLAGTTFGKLHSYQGRPPRALRPRAPHDQGRGTHERPWTKRALRTPYDLRAPHEQARPTIALRPRDIMSRLEVNCVVCTGADEAWGVLLNVPERASAHSCACLNVSKRV